MKVIATDDIKLPLFSEHLKTYVIPVLGNKKNLKSPLKLAGGWRFFKNLRVLQKRYYIYITFVEYTVVVFAEITVV